MDSSALNIILM